MFHLSEIDDTVYVLVLTNEDVFSVRQGSM